MFLSAEIFVNLATSETNSQKWEFIKVTFLHKPPQGALEFLSFPRRADQNNNCLNLRMTITYLEVVFLYSKTLHDTMKREM